MWYRHLGELVVNGEPVGRLVLGGTWIYGVYVTVQRGSDGVLRGGPPSDEVNVRADRQGRAGVWSWAAAERGAGGGAGGWGPGVR